jgi:hypothetical protein
VRAAGAFVCRSCEGLAAPLRLPAVRYGFIAVAEGIMGTLEGLLAGIVAEPAGEDRWPALHIVVEDDVRLNRGGLGIEKVARLAEASRRKVRSEMR